MVRSLLLHLAAFVLRRPAVVILMALVGSLALGSIALTVPVDLSFAGVLGSKDDPVTNRFEAVQARMELATRVLLLLEGPDDQLEEAAHAVGG